MHVCVYKVGNRQMNLIKKKNTIVMFLKINSLSFKDLVETP